MQEEKKPTTTATPAAPSVKPKAKSSGQLYFAVLVLAITLFIVFKSWSASRDIALTLSGTWSDASLDNSLVFQCSREPGGKYLCDINGAHFPDTVGSSNGENLSVAFHIYSLFSGGWVGKVGIDAQRSLTLFYAHRRLRVSLFTCGLDKADASLCQTNEYMLRRVSGKQLWTAKGGYVVALLVVVISCKWIQSSLFGNKVARRRLMTRNVH